MKNRFVPTTVIALLSAIFFSPILGAEEDPAESRFVDLSLLVAAEYPCTWAEGFPRFRIEHTAKIGPQSAYNLDTLIIDGNTGTQMDTPPHSVPRTSVGGLLSNKYGDEFTDKTPPWKFLGEACVVDTKDLLDQAENGHSPHVTMKYVVAWETQHRPLQFGDVVLFQSNYSDHYYRPNPDGRRFMADVLEKKVPAWPDPIPDVMTFLAKERGVRHIGTDSPTMGTMPDLGEPVHYAALKYGAVFTEGATNLDALPAKGAVYCMMGPRHKDGPYGEGRAFGIVGGDLPTFLIDAARKKQVLDLSVVNSIDLPVTWPGKGVDRHRHRYTKNNFIWSDQLQLYHHGHIMDSHAGTHLVPPSYALAPVAVAKVNYPLEVQPWIDEYTAEHGPIGTSDETTEKVSLAQTCGWVRVIDVGSLVGSTKEDQWPASPEIAPSHITAYEAKSGKLKPGEIVLFRSGHTDRHFRPRTQANRCLADPINGKSEGWPALSADSVAYLAKKGIRCVGTDGPTLGGVDPKNALMTYWALGSKGMVGVEFLTNLNAIPDNKKAYFLFAPVKIRDCHGGPGRAIAVY